MSTEQQRHIDMKSNEITIDLILDAAGPNSLATYAEVMIETWESGIYPCYVNSARRTYTYKIKPLFDTGTES
jgi:hypothetical protein